MAEAGNTGLEVDVGITLGKLQRQLAAAEARMIKAATKGEAAFSRANPKIANSFRAPDRAARGFASNGLRQVSFQLSQVAQQGAASGNYLKALAIQLPDLALGFGPLGILIGAAAGALATFGLNVLGTGAKADAAKKAISELEKAVSAYTTAADLASATTASLSEQFGSQAEKVRATLDLLQQIAAAKALDGLNVAIAQLDVSRLRVLVDIFEEGRGEIDAFDDNFKRAMAEMQADFGLTGEQAKKVIGLLEQMGKARGPEEVSNAARALNGYLLSVFGTVQNIPPQFREMAEQAGHVDVAASRIVGTAEAIEAALTDAGSAAKIIANINMAGNIGAAAGQAGVLAGNMRAAAAAAEFLAQAQSKVDNTKLGFGLPGAGDPTVGNANLSFGSGTTSKTRRFVPNFTPPKVTGGKSGGSSKGGSSTPFFEDAERQIRAIERQIILIGKTTAEVAALELKYNLLDEAKKRGLDLDRLQIGTGQTLREGIEAQAETMRRLTEEYEAGVKSQEAFEDGVDGIAGALAGALVNGESFAENMANIFKQLAFDIAKAGIKQAILGSFPGGSTGGGGILSGLFGGIFGGFRADGGPVSAGKSYVVGERGPELYTPSRSGSITANGAGGGKVELVLHTSEGVTVEQAGQIAANVSLRIVQSSAKAQRRALGGAVNSFGDRGTT